jgi:hypothetical protein
MHLVCPDVLVRAHRSLEPTIRVVLRKGTETASGTRLQVRLTEHGNPTSVRQLGHFVDAWLGVRAWYRHMAESARRLPLDEFMEERLAYEVSTMVAKSAGAP